MYLQKLIDELSHAMWKVILKDVRQTKAYKVLLQLAIRLMQIVLECLVISKDSELTAHKHSLVWALTGYNCPEIDFLGFGSDKPVQWQMSFKLSKKQKNSSISRKLQN